MTCVLYLPINNLLISFFSVRAVIYSTLLCTNCWPVYFAMNGSRKKAVRPLNSGSEASVMMFINDKTAAHDSRRA